MDGIDSREGRMVRIVFLGTDCFAATILQSLLDKKYAQLIDVVALYTKEPKGMHLQKSPAHIIADKFDVIVKTPKTLRSEESAADFRDLDIDLAIVASYGLILPRFILEIPPHGCINVHPSKLPRWRGAAPMQRALMAGDKDTAVCIMFMTEDLDAGDIILQCNVDILDDMNFGALSDVSANMAVPMLLKVIQCIENGDKYPVVAQCKTGVTYANKIEKSEERIDWRCSALEINNKIRALSPSPCAYFVHDKKRIKIIKAKVGACNLTHHDSTAYNISVGKIVVSHDADARVGEFGICCGDGVLIKPLLVQKEGGRVMSVAEFLRGYNFCDGCIVH